MARRMTPEGRIVDIVKAAIAVFSQMGYRQAQMAEIAREAGVANGTVYHYFESKLNLFLYVIENGLPRGDVPIPTADTSAPRSEEELLVFLRKRMSERARLNSVARLLNKNVNVDIRVEISEIFTEWWEVLEKNRVQIAIIEKSGQEFPELQVVYDKHGRRYLLDQIKEYLSKRMEIGAIRPLNSIPGMAFAMMESLSWFAWKQDIFDLNPRCSREDVLPDLIAIFATGLEKPKQ